MRALHSGSCSQRKTKWRLIAGAGSLAVFQGVLATVKQTESLVLWFPKRKEFAETLVAQNIEEKFLPEHWTAGM